MPARRLSTALAALLLSTTAPAPALAQPPSPSDAPSDAPPPLTGVERPAIQPTDPARAVASAFLFLPRALIDLLFLASGTAAGLINDEQVVPRVIDLIQPDEGEIGVFPTLFAETGRGRFSVGARMIGNLGRVATGLRAGYGGPDEIVIESRLRISRRDPLPGTISFEAFTDRRTDLEYFGVGQIPTEDPRNRFAPTADAAGAEALYRERRVRYLASIGVRPYPDLEAFFSTSVTRRRTDDPRDAGPAALSRVFQPGTVTGAFTETRFIYTELALRADTRLFRARPSPGLLVEIYGGLSTGIADADADPSDRASPIWLARAGGRVAGFIPIIRRTTVLSPKLVLDAVAELDGPIPFNELPRQPDFRGHDTRRDRVSLVASLDHRWLLLRYLGARLFVDAATVGPSPAELDFAHPRIAAGIGIDVNSASAEIGRAALSFSTEGPRFLLSLGVAPLFGDRQHRE
ncbi:MAG TPA: hypothetical protein VLS89_16090 [Candidatus Nanopelagicales bacterium]|nr:hypothetical protein [Candidatus Nanopelagicales bacterium]